MELRKTLLPPTDDLLTVTREFINPGVSRAGLGRCLRRHGVSTCATLVAPESAAPVTMVGSSSHLRNNDTAR